MLFEVPDNLAHLIPAESRAKFLGELAELDNLNVDPFEHPVEATTRLFGNAEVRIVGTGPDDIKFIAKDVCRALDLNYTSQTLERLDDDEKGCVKIHTLGGPQTLLYLTTPGVNRIIGTCRKPKAKPFQRWMYHDVLVSVQQTGSYSVNEQALKSLGDRLTREIEDIKLSFGLQVTETKLELEAKDAAIVEKDQAISAFDGRLAREKVAAEARQHSELARVTRAKDISSRQKRHGRRSMRREDGWYVPSDICPEMPLPSYYGRHYGHKHVYAGVLTKVMFLWGWKVYSDKHKLWLMVNPPFIPGVHCCWAQDLNENCDPDNPSYHWQLYLREAGIKLIVDRWHKGFEDRTLDDNLADVVKGKAENPAPPPPSA